MEILNFSSKWNQRVGHKLDCKCFTTFRKSSRFNENDQVAIYYNKDTAKELYYGVAIVLEKRKLKVQQLSESICYLDTGYNKDETVNILAKMYKMSLQEMLDGYIYWYLLRYVDNFENNN